MTCCLWVARVVKAASIADRWRIAPVSPVCLTRFDFVFVCRAWGRRRRSRIDSELPRSRRFVVRALLFFLIEVGGAGCMDSGTIANCPGLAGLSYAVCYFFGLIWEGSRVLFLCGLRGEGGVEGGMV